MSEEQLENLLIVIDAMIDIKIASHAVGDSSFERQEFSELKQKFINTFIFGE